MAGPAFDQRGSSTQPVDSLRLIFSTNHAKFVAALFVNQNIASVRSEVFVKPTNASPLERGALGTGVSTMTMKIAATINKKSETMTLRFILVARVEPPNAPSSATR